MSTSIRTLLIAFLAVIAAFVGSTLWVQHAARGIDDDALRISRDAAPGIEIISDVRGELRELQSLVIRRALGRGVAEDEVAASRRRLDDLLGRAVALPAGHDEATLFARMQSAIRSFNESAERVLEQARSGQAERARQSIDQDLRGLADAAGAAARELVDFDAREAATAATRIEQGLRQARRFAYQLDALSAALAIAAAFLVIRALQKVRAVDAENRRLVDRKVEELELFAGRVAHDVLSPLASVSIAFGMGERLAENPKAHQIFKRGSRSLQHVRGIVDGLLEFARAGARPEAGAHADVEPLVRGLRAELDPFAAEHGATLSFEAVPPCAVPCSPGVLLSVLSNLVRNAVKYLGDSSARCVTLRIERRRGRVLFEVEDTGPGIPPSMASSIFQPYVRGKHAGVPGIGLGLATVKRLVESHGGTVGLRSGALGGALFWFELDEAGPRDAPYLSAVADDQAMRDSRAAT